MGRWAQARKRGSTPPAVAAALPSPVLTWDDPNIVWDWADADPASWLIERSLDGETDWGDSVQVSGSDRVYEIPSSGYYYRVVGLDGDDQISTGYSNSVFPT